MQRPPKRGWFITTLPAAIASRPWQPRHWPIFCLRRSTPTASSCAAGILTMLEVARVVGFLAAIFLLVAVAAWVRLFRGQELRGLDGSAAKAGNTEIASQLL